jgi:hypothetical protein
MRKLMALILSVITCWIWSVPVQAAPAPAVRVFVDGAPVDFDVAPVVENGRMLVPVRALSEALGFTVTWDEAEQLVSLTRDGTTIVVWIDSTKVLVGDKESHLEVPTRVVDGRTMVPLRFISETLGSHVAWDGQQFAASIISDSSLRAMLLKALQAPVDQITEGTFKTSMTIQGDEVPGGAITLHSELSFTSHIYKNEMYVKTTALLPFAPATVSEVAAYNGTIYTKASASSPWTKAGTYDPVNISEASAFTGIEGLNGLDLQAEMLGAARIAGVETVQVEGTSALRVTVDLTNVGLEQALQQFSAADLVPGSSASIATTMERFLMTYVMHPDTGFIYQTDIDLAVNLDIADATGTGQMTVALKGSAAAHPTTEPVQFPAGLTK